MVVDLIWALGSIYVAIRIVRQWEAKGAILQIVISEGRIETNKSEEKQIEAEEGDIERVLSGAISFLDKKKEPMTHQEEFTVNGFGDRVRVKKKGHNSGQ